MVSDDGYTMSQAIEEAAGLLESQFGGEADQTATVQLATFLYGAHARDEFIRRHAHEDATRGGPPVTY